MSQKGGDLPTRDQLIKSIRIIKGQRQRANLVRILKSLKNHHNIHVLNEKSVVSLLEDAVNDGLLTKAFKNDEVAYQEFVQSMPKMYKGPKKSQLYAAIQGVINRSTDENGLPLKTICEEMKTSDLCRSMNPVLLKYTVKICCLKMVTRELLVRNGNFFKIGNYGCMANSGEEDESACIVDKAVSDKKPATPIEICSFCMDQNKLDEEGDVEELICCVECGRSGHPSCLQFSKKLTEKVKTLRWQCIECKKCSICAEVTRPDSMLFCDFCDRGFHMDCCQPAIQKPPKGQWSCCICEYEKGQRSKNVRFLKREGGGGFNFRKSSGGLRKYMKKQFLHSFKGKHRSKFDSFDDDNNIAAYESEQFKKTAKEIKSIPDADKELFKRCQNEVKEKLFSNVSVSYSQQRRPLPSEIYIGDHCVNTWYSSPYPNGFNKLPQLHICEFCLTFVETEDILNRHETRCHLRHPPGNEIYRDGEHSVFEVDGNEAKIYSQNLCLLAKLFLDHKTLYYDVEPFLFYVLTINDKSGCHFIGYFSKEKYCQQKYNLSCIMTLPQYQRFGYGGFLIDFSYALSRREGVSGTPEKPLSDLGQLSYQSYWLSVIVEEINKNKEVSVSIKGISEATGLDKQDILSTLMQQHLLQENNGRLKIVIDNDLLMKYENKKRRKVNEEFLKWTPYTLTLPEVEEEPAEKNEEEENERKMRCQKNYLNRRSPLKSRNKDRIISNDASSVTGKQNDHQLSPITSTPLNKKMKLEDESMFASCNVSTINKDLESEILQPKKRGRPKTKITSRWLFDAITPIRSGDKIDRGSDSKASSDPEETLQVQDMSKTIDCSPEIHMVDMGVEEQTEVVENGEVIESGEVVCSEVDIGLSMDCTSQHIFEPI